jgi:hypothetical protein
MSTLTFEEIRDIIEAGEPDWIKRAKKYTKKLDVHINGIGTADYLDHVQGFENSAQYSLRKKYATSNKFVFENLLRPVDKVFNAAGGSTTIKTKTDFSDKTLATKIDEVFKGMSIRKWIEQIQSNKYYSDPSGLVFFEWNDTDTTPTLKSVHILRNYETDARSLEWVLFEPEKRIDNNGQDVPGEFYRLVDDAFDYTIHVNDKKYTIVEDETFSNPWGFVPAILNSNLINSTFTYHISPIDSVIELADHYLTTTSVKNIYEFLHGYPIFWAYVQPCKRCDGTGLYEGADCVKCDGDGHTFKKDVSDIIKLKPPKNNEEPNLAPDVAGYVQPDLNTWREQRTELDWLWGLMHFTMWGTARQEKGDNETATAAFIDTQPVNDRLNKFSDAYEQLENLMIDIVGKFYARDNYEGASVNYGRRFLVEPPDVIWKKYMEAKESGSPKVSLDYLLIQFYQSEFKDDKKSLIIAQKGIKLEPFVHKTDEEINSLPVLDEDKIAKYYFNEFWKNVDKQDILIKDVDKLRQEFITFLETKKRENGNNE